VVKKVLDFIFPNFSCLVCGDEINVSAHAHVCNACLNELDLARPSRRTAKSVFGEPGKGKKHPWRHSYTAFLYTGEVVGLVMNFKYSHQGLVAKFAAPILVEQMLCEGAGEYDVVVPVPLAQKRLSERGYNQAELLAEDVVEALAKEQETKVVLLDSILIKTRETEPQVEMATKKRQENQKGAYALVDKDRANELLNGKRVLIVDDVMTSGATLTECARVLKSAGAEVIDIATIARIGS